MAINKVLLITPPAFGAATHMFRDIQPEPPMGLAYIGAVLEREGIEVRIVDSLIEGFDNEQPAGEDLVLIGLDFKEIESLIREYRPDMLGISCLFTRQRENAHRIAGIAKGISRDIVTVMGGAHPTVCPGLVMEDPNMDYVVLGEGELTIMDLIEHYRSGKSLDETDGIGYRENGRVVVKPRVRFIEDLDSIPFPARHLLNMEAYFGLKESHGIRKKKKYSPIITSRGCPFKCVFCTANKVWGRKFRKRSPENVISEMEHIKEKYGIEELMFEDDNVTLDPRRAERIFDLMKEKHLGFEWDTPNGVAAFTLNREIIKKMVDAGCYRMNLAIESGNQFHLTNNIRKPLKLEKIPPFVDYIRELGCEPSVFIVLGVPGETEEMVWDSIRFAAELGIYSPFFSIATPYPGSEMLEICKEKGYLKEEFTLDDLFIRSYSINTPQLKNERLREAYQKGRRWLLLQHFKNHPIEFIAKYIKLIAEADLLSIRFMLKEIGLIKKKKRPPS
jgi:magnesium-protoporphyrin IX monomethyl ester (oxidative) cyclase